VAGIVDDPYQWIENSIEDGKDRLSGASYFLGLRVVFVPD
jgi:hypothetical protein